MRPELLKGEELRKLILSTEDPYELSPLLSELVRRYNILRYPSLLPEVFEEAAEISVEASPRDPQLYRLYVSLKALRYALGSGTFSPEDYAEFEVKEERDLEAIADAYLILSDAGVINRYKAYGACSKLYSLNPGRRNALRMLEAGDMELAFEILYEAGERLLPRVLIAASSGFTGASTTETVTLSTSRSEAYLDISTGRYFSVFRSYGMGYIYARRGDREEKVIKIRALALRYKDLPEGDPYTLFASMVVALSFGYFVAPGGISERVRLRAHAEVNE